MGESVSTWTPSCNGYKHVELDGQGTTSDSGALLLREALDSSGVITAIEDHMVDHRDPMIHERRLRATIRGWSRLCK